MAEQDEDKTPKSLSAKPANGRAVATGSQSADFQSELLDQLAHSLWHPSWKTDEDKMRAIKAAYATLASIRPKNELEGMLAVQMIATHSSAMECIRRAMIERQTPQERDLNLKHATKLISLYERQFAALDKHRGNGQQKIIVEHVTVEAGGQAIVGNVSSQRRGYSRAGSPQAR